MTEQTRSNLEKLIRDETLRLKSSFDLLPELRDIYPQRIIQACEHNAKFGTDRRARGEFVAPDILRILNTKLKTFSRNLVCPRKKKWADILILYLVSGDPERIREVHTLLEKRSYQNTRVILSLPRSLTELSDALLKRKVLLKLLEQDKTAQHHVLHQILKDTLKNIAFLIRRDHWSWYYMGGWIETTGVVRESEIISHILDSLYPGAINPENLSLSKFHSISSTRRAGIRHTIDRILDFDQPLTIRELPEDGKDNILNSLLHMGFLREISTGSSVKTLEPCGFFPGNTPAVQIWKTFHDKTLDVLRVGRQVNLLTLTRRLLAEPLGITPAMFKILLALFWRKYHKYLMFCNLSGGRVRNVDTISFQRITDMLRYPDRWRLGLRQIRKEEIPYLRGILELLVPEKASAIPHTSLWGETLRILYWWYRKRIYFIRNREFSNNESHRLLQILERHPHPLPPEMFLRHIPEAFSFDLSSLDLVWHTPMILESLEFAVKEIESTRKQVLEEIMGRIPDLFRQDPLLSHLDPDSTLSDYLRTWKELTADSRSDSVEETDIFRNIPGVSDSIDEYFIRTIPQMLGMKPIEEWTEDHTGEFLAKLSYAKFRISSSRYLDLVKPGNPDRKRELLLPLFIESLREGKLSTEELKQSLDACLVRFPSMDENRW